MTTKPKTKLPEFVMSRACVENCSKFLHFSDGLDLISTGISRQDGQDGRKITQLKWPKYQYVTKTQNIGTNETLTTKFGKENIM